MIAFVRSGSDIFPETRVVYYDDAGNNSSSTLVKAGESFVDVYQNSGVTRWGDYTGISRKQNSSTPVVWLSGSYGAFQAGENAQNTWIAQVTGINIGIPVLTDPGKRMIKVFPNPAADKFSLEFSVDKRTLVEIMLNDASGKMVKLLMKDVAEEGKNLFSFNKGVLSSGIYFVQIRSGNKIIANEKMVIE
jgi:hypothetical protein